MEPLWRIELLGSLTVSGQGKTLTRLRTRKTEALLAFLAYYLGHDHARGKLAEMFWPCSEAAAARLNLRSELSALRRLLEPEGIERGAVLAADYLTVRLNPGVVQTDVDRFEQTLRAAERPGESVEERRLLRQGIAQYGEGLLPDCDAEWLLPERERLAQRCLQALLRLAALLHEAGETGEALQYAERAVATDPLCEEAYAKLITLQIALDRRTEALRSYRQLEQRLWGALGIAPLETTRALVNSLLSSERIERSVSAASLPLEVTAETVSYSGTTLLNTGTLPLPATRFFGRQKELDLIRRRLSTAENDPEQTRLLTLTGIGGSGKTRLALEAGRMFDAMQERGVLFVPLADLKPEASLPERIAEAMGLPADPATDPLAQILAVMRACPLLLILDNFEHLVSSAKQILSRLLQIENARFLITSRHRLGLPGERELPVQPLRIPDEGQHSPEAILASESVQMFLDRAQAVRPDFVLTTANARDCAALCRRLDGLPLGIDLVAGWASLLTPAQMMARMDRNEALRSRQGFGAEARHASLEAAMDWSWNLLDPASRRFLAALVVFRGSWSLEAAEAVFPYGKTLERLEALQARSLLMTEEQGGEVRFRLLEPVRAYLENRGAERERRRAAERHASYYFALAERAERELWRDAPMLYGEQRNFLAALDTLQGREMGIRLAAMLGAFWQRSGHLSEAEYQIGRMLASCTEAAPVWRAKACAAGAIIARLLGKRGEQQALCAEACLLCDGLSTDTLRWTALLPFTDPILLLLGIDFVDETGCLEELLRQGRTIPRFHAFLLGITGKRACFLGRYLEAEAYVKEGLERYREMADRLGMAVLLYQRGEIAVYRGELEEAQRIWQQCLALYRGLGFQIGVARTLTSLGYLARLQFDFRRAATLAEQVVSFSRSYGLLSLLASALWLTGTIALHRGQYAQATPVLEEGLEICRAQNERGVIADTLHALAMVAANQGDFSRAQGLLTEALELRRQELDQLDIAISLGDLGLIALAQEDWQAAERLLQESLDLLCALQCDVLKARILGRLGLAACRRDQLNRAAAYLHECLTLLFREPNLLGIVEGLEAAAELCIGLRRMETAAILLARAEAIRESLGTPPPLRESLRRHWQEHLLQTNLEPVLREKYGQRGRAMTWEQAITYALAGLVDLPSNGDMMDGRDG